MNPDVRIHKDLVIESHQGLLQQDKKQHSLTLDQTGSEISTRELAAHCVGEINNIRWGEPGTETYGIELLRRATMQGDQEARECIKLCFSEIVLSWLRRHPDRETVCELDSDENYITQTFERFWQATTLTQRIEFNSLAGALRYLHACLNGTMVDTLRTYSRSKEIPLPDPEEPGVLPFGDGFESNEVWDNLQKVIPGYSEQRLAYLLFHCGLKPKEIMRFCPHEFGNVDDIHRLRCKLMNRLLQNAEHLRWQLN